MVKTVGDLLEDIKYGTSAKANNTGDGYLILRMNNITTEGTLSLSDLKHIKLNDEEYKKYSLSKGDILINRTNSKELVGKCALFNEDGKYVFASYLIRMRVKKELILPEYLVLYLALGPSRQEITKRIRGVTNQWNINSTEIKSIPIRVPSIEDQEIILSNYYGLVKNEIINNERKKLQSWVETLPHSVLTKAFRGELIV